jgi:hypothetical protein
MPEELTVNISMYGTSYFGGAEVVDNFLRADVSGMPNFITFRKMLQITVIPISVSIGK